MSVVDKCERPGDEGVKIDELFEKVEDGGHVVLKGASGGRRDLKLVKMK